MTRHPDKEWITCPDGEITRLGQKLRHRQQRRAFLQVASVATAAAAMWGVTQWLGKCKCGQKPGELSCQRVEELAGVFLAGNLSNEVGEQVRSHLLRCPRCARLYQELQGKVS